MSSSPWPETPAQRYFEYPKAHILSRHEKGLFGSEGKLKEDLEEIQAESFFCCSGTGETPSIMSQSRSFVILPSSSLYIHFRARPAPHSTRTLNPQCRLFNVEIKAVRGEVAEFAKRSR